MDIILSVKDKNNVIYKVITIPLDVSEKLKKSNLMHPGTGLWEFNELVQSLLLFRYSTQELNDCYDWAELSEKIGLKFSFKIVTKLKI